MSLDAPSVAEEVGHARRDAAVPGRAEKEKAYLKSDRRISACRCRSSGGSSEARGPAAHPDLTHDDLVALVAELWSAPVDERRMAAIEFLVRANLLSRERRHRTSSNGLIREAKTWALVDTLAVSVTGGLIERDASLATRWIDGRRTTTSGSAARPMLALLGPLKARGRRLRAVRSLRRRHARGEGVLHPQSDRLGAARDLEEATGSRLRMARAARAPGLRESRCAKPVRYLDAAQSDALMAAYNA